MAGLALAALTVAPGLMTSSMAVAKQVLSVVEDAKGARNRRRRLLRALWLEARQNSDFFGTIHIARDKTGSAAKAARKDAKVTDRSYLPVVEQLQIGAHLALLLATELEDETARPVAAAESSGWHFLSAIVRPQEVKLDLMTNEPAKRSLTVLQTAGFVVEKVTTLRQAAALHKDAPHLLRDFKPISRLENIARYERGLIDTLRAEAVDEVGALSRSR